MTWSAAKSDGEARAEFLLARLRESPHSLPASIRLVDYESEEDYDFLRPGDPWSHGYQKIVLRAVKRRLRKAGFKVELRTLRMRDYFDWLTSTGQSNTTANRAAFISL